MSRAHTSKESVTVAVGGNTMVQWFQKKSQLCWVYSMKSTHRTSNVAVDDMNFNMAEFYRFTHVSDHYDVKLCVCNAVWFCAVAIQRNATIARFLSLALLFPYTLSTLLMKSAWCERNVVKSKEEKDILKRAVPGMRKKIAYASDLIDWQIYFYT